MNTEALTTQLALARQIAAAVPDPEIPVVNIEELGILRDVVSASSVGLDVVVTITPTYSGCPAMDQIRDDIVTALSAQGIRAGVQTALSPPWTSDWITAKARAKLKAFGIAPPRAEAVSEGSLQPVATFFVATNKGNSSASGQILSQMGVTRTVEPVPCPRCNSIDTVEVAHFGSTACKAQLRCLHCKEPFDYFKPY